jgi:hypothetical protein
MAKKPSTSKPRTRKAKPKEPTGSLFEAPAPEESVYKQMAADSNKKQADKQSLDALRQMIEEQDLAKADYFAQLKAASDASPHVLQKGAMPTSGPDRYMMAKGFGPSDQMGPPAPTAAPIGSWDPNTPLQVSSNKVEGPGKPSVKSWNLLRKAGSYAKNNPGNVALGALGAISTVGLVGDLGADLAKELYAQVAGDFTGYQSPGRRQQNAAVDAQIQAALNERKRQMDMQRLQQAAAQNAQLMMQMQPELYQKVVYGRSVPRGGRIIGGTQLPDALERLAASIPRGA